MKIVKKALKILSITLLSVVLFVGLLFFVAKLAENKITTLALERVSKVIKAPVKINNVSFTLLRRFPLATIEFSGVHLGGNLYGDFTDTTLQANDTLVNIGSIYFSVKTKPLLDSKFDIVRIEFVDANLNYRIDSVGRTCYDFLMDTTAVPEPETPVDTAPTPLDVLLRELHLKNVVCRYIDEQSNIKATVALPDMTINGKIEGEKYSGAVKGNLELTQCAMEGYNLHLMRKTAVDFEVEYQNDSVVIDKMLINTDGAQFKLIGGVSLLGTMPSKLSFEAIDLNFTELLKYAPDTLLPYFGVQQFGGIMNVSANIEGNLTDSTALPFYSAQLKFEQGVAALSGYPVLTNMAFNGTVTNGALKNNATTSAVFNKFHVETGTSKVDLSFAISNLDHLNYSVNTNLNLNLTDFKSLVPDTLIQQLNGQLSVKLQTNGVLPDSIDDAFTNYVLDHLKMDIAARNFNITMDSLEVKNMSADFSYHNRAVNLSGFNVHLPTYNVRLKNTGLNLKFWGDISQMATMGADIQHFNLETDSCKVSGSAWVHNLDRPNYRLKTSVNLNLAELAKFVPDTVVTAMNGIVKLDMETYGTVHPDSISQQINKLVFEQSRFNLAFNNINVEMPDTLMQVQRMSGAIKLDSDTLTVNKFGGTVAGIDFFIDSTYVSNLYKAYLLGLPNFNLIMETNVHLGTFNYAMLDAFAGTDTVAADTTGTEMADATAPEAAEPIAVTDSTKTDSIAPPLLPDFKAMGIPHFLIRGKFSMDRVVYDKNIIDNISTLFRFSDSLYVMDQFLFETSGGKFNTSVKLDARNWEQPVVDIKNYISGLDLQKLLELNDNFGDTLLTSDKVSGILTSELHARAFYVNGNWPNERIRAKGHFKLENGKIYNYPPLAELSKSLKLFGGLDELDRLDFSTLTTSLFIFKDKIYIPKTDVVTSAVDLSAFAMQSFKEDYEYHIEVFLKDVLVGKSKKLMEAQAKQNKKDGTPVERSGLKLVSMKIGKESKNGFDSETLRKKFASELNKQQGFLNIAFNPSLVNFSTNIDRTAHLQQYLKTDTIPKPDTLKNE